MTKQLGCATEYQVLAIEENAGLNPVTGVGTFGKTVGEIDGITSIEYDRRLDDTSVATIVIGSNADCCTSGFIEALHSWHHGLAIFRNGELVWDGPIVTIKYTRTSVTITAHDVSALLTKRWLPRDLCFSNDPLVCTGGSGGLVLGPQAPEEVAFTLITEAFTYDSHGAYPVLFDVSTESYEASYKQYGGPVFDLIQKLASDYINWTTLGRSIIISRGGLLSGAALARTDMLMCDDFVGDTFSVTEDGLAALTQDAQIADAIVSGGVEQTGQNIGVAQIFPLGDVADAYYGLLQGIQSANRNLTLGSNPLAALSQAALNVVNSAYPPPVTLDVEDLQLASTAPVLISELVPGTIVPIFADCICRQVSQEFVLAKVVVNFDANGETVKPSLIARGGDNPGAGSQESD